MVPLFPVTPAIFILFLLIVTVNVIISDPEAASIGLGLFLAGLPLYYLIKKVIENPRPNERP
jgi:APA family basic amino acid/polyamine antiporter